MMSITSTHTTRTPVTALMSMEPLANFEMVGFFGELAVQSRAKLIYSIYYPSDVKVFNALKDARAEEVLELALFAQYTTPFGSSSEALREAIRQRAAVPRDSQSLLRQKVLSDELWFGWMTENGVVFSTSACDAVARTFYDSSLAYAPAGPGLTQATSLYGTDTDFMYRTRAAFHETHFAACKFNSVTDRQRLDEHRAPTDTRRAGRKVVPPTGFPVISHPAKRFTGDVICPNKDGVYDPDARPCFVAVDEPTTGAFTARLVSSLELLGMRTGSTRKSASSPSVQPNRKRAKPAAQPNTTAPKRNRRPAPADQIILVSTALDEAVAVLGEETQQAPLADELLAPVADELLAPLVGKSESPVLQPAPDGESGPIDPRLAGEPLVAGESHVPLLSEPAHTIAYVPPLSPTDTLLKDFWNFDAAKELHAAVWADESDLLDDAELGQKFDALFTKVVAPLLDETTQTSAFHTGASSTIDWSMQFDSFSQLPTLGDAQE